MHKDLLAEALATHIQAVELLAKAFDIEIPRVSVAPLKPASSVEASSSSSSPSSSEEEGEPITLKELQLAAEHLIKSKRRDHLKKVLEDFEAQNLSAINPQDYPQVLKALASD